MLEDDHEHSESAMWVARVLFILLILVGFAVLIRMASRSFVFGIVGNLIGFFVIILVFVWLFSLLFRWPWHRHMRRMMMDERRIARRRYARGEISRKEYMGIIKDLKETEE